MMHFTIYTIYSYIGNVEKLEWSAPHTDSNMFGGGICSCRCNDFVVPHKEMSKTDKCQHMA